MQGLDYHWSYAGTRDSINWHGVDLAGRAVDYPDLPLAEFVPDNLSAVVQSLMLLGENPDIETLATGIGKATLSGRFQCLERGHTLVLDVAHNPHAAGNLADRLEHRFTGRKIRIVLAMLKDKDSEGFIRALKGRGISWYVGEIKQDRGSPAKILYNQLLAQGESSAQWYDTIGGAFVAAESAAGPKDVVLVTGSFFTVAEVMARLAVENSKCA